ncbi:hypothetical protein HPB51_017781 [Rhipicephalus microplus]|uniref:Retrotransposon gag domain-containing protein n=1 Tax=Rhipicephalus microplus TaxID=6941 RepID=A0A9J6EB20_RHIMP|nr:hypothetical protein HPB51_017781 [Rhipicephalus microplus]
MSRLHHANPFSLAFALSYGRHDVSIKNLLQIYVGLRALDVTSGDEVLRTCSGVGTTRKGSSLSEIPGADAATQLAPGMKRMAEPVTQVVRRIGHMEPFDDSSSDWTSYDERLTSFLHFNKVPEADKVHAFLSVIGMKTYALLESLATPDLPSSKSSDTFKKLLGDHFAPKHSVIRERAKFHRQPQRENESIADFVAKPRCLLSSSDYPYMDMTYGTSGCLIEVMVV